MIRRADPALRDTDRLLAILADQKDQLAQLAKDSETIMHPLGPRARPRRRLLRQRRLRRPGDRREEPGPGGLAAEIPDLPAPVPPHDAQPPGLLRPGAAGHPGARQGGPLADRRDPAPAGLLRRLDGGAAQPRPGGPGVRGEVPRRRPGRAPGPRPRPVGRAAADQLRPLPRHHPEDGRLREPDGADLQHDRPGQRVRQIRPLPAHEDHAGQLLRLHPEPGDPRRRPGLRLREVPGHRLDLVGVVHDRRHHHRPPAPRPARREQLQQSGGTSAPGLLNYLLAP